MKKGKGICMGLAIGNDGERIHGGVYSALKRGECRMIPLDTSLTTPQILEFTNVIGNVFIEVDRHWEKG